MIDLSALGAWTPLLQPELEKPYFRDLLAQVEGKYQSSTVFPPQEEIFFAFRCTPPARVRVVILGQDPYHEPEQAHGLAFSVKAGVRMPPSLQNISKELQSDLGLSPLSCGCLTPWARQGVFLLNSVLTVEAGHANSHKTLGWQRFTDAVTAAIAQLPQPVVFVLWGAQAQKKAAVAAASPYPRLILQSAHPSPLSAYRGFFGSRPFSQVNAFLTANGEPEINWQL